MKVENNLEVFDFNGMELSVLIQENGEPLFLANDVCKHLGLSNVPAAVSKLDEDEKLLLKKFISGQNREVNFVTESGLYSLTMRSRKHEAKQFKRWVTSEVLPSIRKTGSYSAKQSLGELISNPDTIIELANRWKEQIRLTEEAKREIEKKDVIISYLEPKAAATDELLSTNQTLDIGTFAKVINWGPNKLFDQLRRDGYLIQSGEKHNQPYAHYVGKYFEVTEKVWEKKNGDKCISVQSRITPKGQVYFANKYSIRKNLPVFNQFQGLTKTVYS